MLLWIIAHPYLAYFYAGFPFAVYGCWYLFRYVLFASDDESYAAFRTYHARHPRGAVFTALFLGLLLWPFFAYAFLRMGWDYVWSLFWKEE